MGHSKGVFNRAFLGLCVLSLLLAVGCMNPYRENYKSAIDRWPGSVSARVLVPQGQPELASSTDLKKDAHYLLEKGYALLGRSKFKSRSLDENQAMEQAKDVGAWLVLVNHQYAETVTEQVAQVTILPSQTVTTTHTVAGPKGQFWTQTDTQTVSGGTQVDWVPQNVDYYDYSATYWAKTLPSPIGVLVKGPRANAAPASTGQDGLAVQVVVLDSPAAAAGLREGDRLVSLAGETLWNVDQFYDAVSRHAGHTITVGFTRGGMPMAARVTLKAE